MAKKRVARKRTVRKKRTRTTKLKRKVVRRRPKARRKKISGKRAKPRKKATPRKKGRRKSPAAKKVLKQVERVSVERTVAGRKRKRRSKSAPKQRSRRRAVSGKGGIGLLIGLAVGVGAYLLLSNMSKTPTTTPYYGSLNPTSNITRNTQSQDILNYALAAGLAAEAIYKLIDRLNNSSDSEVAETSSYVATTNDFSWLA